jgi:hypothetical protein
MIEIWKMKHAWNCFDEWRANSLFGIPLGSVIYRPHGIGCREIRRPHVVNDIAYGRTISGSDNLLSALGECSIDGNFVPSTMDLVI